MSSVFKIFSPEDCDFYYDGDRIGHITGNSPKAFRFEVERKGKYRVLFINSEFKSELRMTLTIDADEEQDIELNFSEVNAEAKRRIRIEEDKRKAAEGKERPPIEEEKQRVVVPIAKRPLRIQYTRPTTQQVMQLMGELDKRRKSTFPFTVQVRTTIESHGVCELDTKQIQQGIIKLTIDPVMTDAEYQHILDWLLSEF